MGNRKKANLSKKRKIRRKQINKKRAEQENVEPSIEQKNESVPVVNSSEVVGQRSTQNVPSNSKQQTDENVERKLKVNIKGSRIADVQLLFNGFKSIEHNEGFNCNFSDLEMNEDRFELKSIIIAKCTKCNKVTKFPITDDNDGDVNKQAVAGALAAGMSYSDFAYITYCTDLPVMSEATFRMFEAEILEEKKKQQ